jgi:hypothetical protein
VDDDLVRKRTERTGKHYCIKCLAEVPAEENFRNDHICDDCAAGDEYPLKSTPDPAAEPAPRRSDPKAKDD